MSLKNFVSYDSENRIWKGLRSHRVYNNEVSVGYLILNVIKQTPQRVMEIFDDTGAEVTCLEIYERSVKIINFLSHSGLRQDDVAGFVTRNSENLTPILIACLTLGLPINPLMSLMNEKDIIHTFSNTKPKIIFCDSDVVEKIQKCCELMQLQAKIVTFMEKTDGYEFVDEILKMDVNLDDFTFPDLKDISSSFAFILCSSGTTESLKSICKSHKMIINQDYPMWKTGSQNEIIFSPSGIFWIPQILMFIFASLYNMTRVITAKNINAKSMNGTVLKNNVTFVMMPPFFASEFLKDDSILPMDSIRNCLIGGEKYDQEFLDKLQRVFPKARVMGGYGSTEIDILTCGQHKQRGSGHLFGDAQIKIIDENNRNLGPNETGEICCKTTVMFSGYYNQPEKYKEAVKDNWVYTGDLGYMDNDGFLFVVGRNKSLLKYRGFHITPSEVEQVINEIDGVTESCVVGVFDTEEKFHILYAFATKTKESNISEEFIKEYVNSNVSEYKKIRGTVMLLDELPKTGTGKINSSRLKEMAEKIHFKRFIN